MDTPHSHPPALPAPKPPLAWVLDALALTIACAAAAFLWFRVVSGTLLAAIGLSCLVTALTGYVSWRILLARNLKRNRKLLPLAYGLWQCQRYCTLPFSAMESVTRAIMVAHFGCSYNAGIYTDAKGRVFPVLLRTHPQEKVPAQTIIASADEARELGATRLCFFCTGYYTQAALDTARNMQGIEMILMDMEEFAALIYGLDQGDVPKSLGEYVKEAERMLQKRRRDRRRSLRLHQPLRLGLAAVALAFMARITPYTAWYMACACIALIIAGVVAYFNVRRARQGG